MNFGYNKAINANLKTYFLVTILKSYPYGKFSIGNDNLCSQKFELKKLPYRF